MLVRNDLRIFDLYLSNSESIKGGIDYRKLFDVIAKDGFYSNRSYSNKERYKKRYENHYSCTLEHAFPQLRNNCFDMNIKRNFLGISILDDKDNSDVISILWDIIPKETSEIYSLLEDIFFYDISSQLTSEVRNNDVKINGPKRDSDGEYITESSMRLSPLITEKLKALIHSILVEKLTNRIFNFKEAVTKKRRKSQLLLNTYGNFPDIHFEADNYQSLFSNHLSKAVLSLDSKTMTLFSTKSVLSENCYKGLGKTISNTITVYEKYSKLWNNFFDEVKKEIPIMDQLKISCIKNIAFEDYSKISLVEMIKSEYKCGRFNNYRTNIQMDFYSQLFYRMSLLLIFELPYPLSKFFFMILLSDAGVLFKYNKQVTREEIEALIDYLHTIVFNLIPALEGKLSEIVETVEESQLEIILRDSLKALEEYGYTDKIDIPKTNDDKSGYDDVENSLNLFLGYKAEQDNDSFFIDIFSRKTLNTVLYDWEFKRYYSLIDSQVSPSDVVSTAAKENTRLEEYPYEYKLLLPFYDSLGRSIIAVDKIKLDYREKYHDYDQKADERGESDFDKFKQEILDRKQIEIDNISGDLIWQYIKSTYKIETLVEAEKGTAISKDILSILKDWIDSEELDEGGYERVNSDGKLIMAKNEDIRLDIEGIKSLAEKYGVSKEDLALLHERAEALDNRFTVSIRRYLDDSNKQKEFSMVLHSFLCFFIECLFDGSERKNLAYNRMASYYWNCRNNYTCKNL